VNFHICQIGLKLLGHALSYVFATFLFTYIRPINHHVVFVLICGIS